MDIQFVFINTEHIIFPNTVVFTVKSRSLFFSINMNTVVQMPALMLV